MILRDFARYEDKDAFDYDPDDESDKGVAADLIISIDGLATRYAVSGWPVYVDSDGTENPAGYCITSEYGEWINSGLIYCGIVKKELIFRWDSDAVQKLGLIKDEPITLEIDNDRIVQLWKILVKVFGYAEVSGIKFDFR